MVCITLPDGTRRGYERPFTGTEIALSISPSLARQTVAMVVDGDTRDLSDVIARDASIAFIARDDPRALPLVRHDAAHVLAEAVQELFPGTQATIGPVIENGFYYDFARATPFTSHDLPKIEARMREIVARNRPLTKEIWGREVAKAFFRDRGEDLKVELVDAIPEGEAVTIYRQGDWLDLCRGPHMRSTGDIGSAFRLTKVVSAHGRGDADNTMLTRIYGTAFARQEDLEAHLQMLEDAGAQCGT